MKKLSSWLSTVLVLQIIVAGGIFFTKQQGVKQEVNEPLISFESESLDKIVISDADNKTTLVKKDNAWMVPDYYSLPVNQQKLQGILDNLNGLKSGWPVATSSRSHERFEVDEEKFQKRVQLFSGDKAVGDIYIGTSPGYRKAHVRAEGEDEVFTADISAYEYAVKPSDWMSKEVLLTPQISSIEAKDYSLQKQGESWTFAGDLSAENVDTEKANALANAVEKLYVQNAVASSDIGEGDKNGSEIESSETEIKISADGKAFTYQFIHSDDKYYVKRNDFETVFEISKIAYESIIQKNANDLAVKSPSTEDEAKASTEPVETNS